MSKDIKQYSSVHEASYNTKDEYIGIYSHNWYDDNDRIIKNPYYKQELEYSNDSNNDINENKIDKTKNYDTKINIPNMAYKLKVTEEQTIIVENLLNKNGFEKEYINEKYVLISTFDNQKIYVDSDKATFKNENDIILIDFDVFYYLCNTKITNNINHYEDYYKNYNTKSKNKIALDKLNDVEYQIPKEWYIAYEKNCQIYFIDSQMKRIQNINIKDYEYEMY